MTVHTTPLLASRRLTLINGQEREQVRVEIGPLKDHDSYTSCHVHIEGTDGGLDQDICGMDGIQALQLALKFAGSTLDRLSDSWECGEERGHGFELFPNLKAVS